MVKRIFDLKNKIDIKLIEKQHTDLFTHFRKETHQSDTYTLKSQIFHNIPCNLHQRLKVFFEKTLVYLKKQVTA